MNPVLKLRLQDCDFINDSMIRVNRDFRRKLAFNENIPLGSASSHYCHSISGTNEGRDLQRISMQILCASCRSTAPAPRLPATNERLNLRYDCAC